MLKEVWLKSENKHLALSIRRFLSALPRPPPPFVALLEDGEGQEEGRLCSVCLILAAAGGAGVPTNKEWLRNVRCLVFFSLNW